MIKTLNKTHNGTPHGHGHGLLRRRDKGIALIITLLLLVFLVIFAQVVWSSYIADSFLQKRYEFDVQSLYDLEAAKTACLWEEEHANPKYTWETTSNTNSNLYGSSITGKFYRLAGFNFRAQAAFTNGLSILVHAFKGTEANPTYSQYLEYIDVKTPLYQFTLFSNGNLTLPMPGYDGLIHCYGGKVHANGDIIFDGNWVNDSYLRLDQVGQMTSAGNMRYDNNSGKYPSPWIIDEWDGVRDGMAPAPNPFEDYLSPGSTNHTFPTTGEAAYPGPIGWKWYAGELGYYWWPLPWLWRGDRGRFVGGQEFGPGWDSLWMTQDGGLTRDPYDSNIVNIHQFYLSDVSGSSLVSRVDRNGYDQGGAYFRPYTNSSGNLNNDWFQIPAGLPESYTWDKYEYRWWEGIQPITFYATEKCASGNAGCYGPDMYGGESWRYIKKAQDGHTCAKTDTSCYNNANSKYVKAQDYTLPNGKKYFDNIWYGQYDNMEFFSDFTYGNDIDDPNSPYRQILHFDTAQQPQGFQEYLSLLSQNNVQDILIPQVEKKEMSMGQLFDDTGVDSLYKTKAQQAGLYISASNVDSVITSLNQGGCTVARKVSFYNWQTSQKVNLIDIDLGIMRQCNKSPSNGMVYVEGIPIRFSNATNIPGTNSADGKKAVFTVVSEESVFLKGDYNTQDWKISNIATQKKIYTLSNAFTDPQTNPTWAIYPDYPLIYMKWDNGWKEADPAKGDGWWTEAYHDYWWIPQDINQWVDNKANEKQWAWESQAGFNPPNAVDKNYEYNSLFITYYPVDDRLENWSRCGQNGCTVYNRTITGSVLDLYANIPEYGNYARWPGPNETVSDSDYSNFDFRGRHDPGWSSWWYPMSYGPSRFWHNDPYRYMVYDARFPTAMPNNYEAVLGVTGTYVWRIITPSYFYSHIQ